MLLGPKANITIVSDVSFFTAVYARVYQMSVEATDETGASAIITVSSYDKVPSGYRAGGSEQLAKAKFSVGDKVSFNTKRGGTVTGEITKINTKTIVVKEGFTSWKVSPSLLTFAD